MLNVGEDIFKCDMAETYHVHITDWENPPFPISYIADLAAGLKDDSRIKLKISDRRLSLEQVLQTFIIDKLSTLIWQNTKDGHKGRNFPKSLYRTLEGLDEKQKDELQEYDSVEDFQEWYKEKHHG